MSRRIHYRVAHNGGWKLLEPTESLTVGEVAEHLALAGHQVQRIITTTVVEELSRVAVRR